MSTLDAKLIREFQLVPALYDKNNVNFKNKEFVERAWNNIAAKLCYDVNILKDRMYQLRNRYNVEKRRLQSLRDEGLPNPKSLWPLYHNLNFLGSYIRQRKSYNKMMRMSAFTVQTGFRGFTKAEGESHIVHPYVINRRITIKKESDGQIKPDVNESMARTNDTMIFSDVPQQSTSSKTSQTLQNINQFRRSLLADDDCSGKNLEGKIPKIHQPSHKFEAFGSFVSHSLQDLPEQKALGIVDRFTSEIVKSLIEHAENSHCC